jgi:hypothetical protein
MTPKQYRAAIDYLGLSQVRAGKFLGVTGRASQRWALGESRVPEAVAILLRLMISLELSPEEVQERIAKVKLN